MYFKNFTEVMIMKDKGVQEINQLESKSKRRRSTLPWEKIYKYAKIYYEHYGNLEVPTKFKTNDGFTFDENGTIKEELY